MKNWMHRTCRCYCIKSYQDAFLEQSISIADEIQQQFQNRVKRRNRGVKQQPLAVLRGSTMPAVLVELGFLTNPGEEDFLQSSRGKELLASAIYRAVKSYKQKRESRDAVVMNDFSESSETGTTAMQGNDQSEVVVEENNAPKETTESNTVLNASLYYTVQIAVSRNDLPLLPENFMGLKEFIRKKSGLFKYFCGKAYTYQKHKNLSTRLETTIQMPI